MVSFFRWLRTILAVVALGVSAYLLWLSADHAAGPALCGDSELADCDEVLDSRWAHWLGMPVSLPAVAIYLTLAVAPWFEDRRFSPRLRRAAMTVSVALATVAGGAAIWFIGIQLLHLHKICPFCMTVHGCGLTIAGLVIASLVISRRPVSSQDAGVERARRLLLGGPAVPSAVTAEMGSRPGGGWVGGAVAAGAALLSLFISIQLMVVPATIVVQRIPPIDPLKLEHPIALSVDPPPKNGEAKRSESVTTADAGSEPSNGGAGSDMSDDASESEAERSDGAVPQERPVDATDSAAEDPQRGVDPQHADPGVTADAGEGDGQPTGDGESVGDRESIDLESLDPANSTAEHRKLLGGKVKFVPADQMVLGKPDAPHLLAELFDYTCPHCRRMHGLLEQVRQRYGDSLGIVLLPVPLNAGCNRFVAKTYGRHIYACLYPRLALQVWNGNREAFEDFHKWLMEGDEPPPPGQARDRADRLCQEGGSRQRLSERWIDQHIKASVEVYGVCEPRGLPRLLFPDAISAGAASDVDGLSAILEEHLGIRPVEGATGPADGSDHATGGAKK